MRKCDHTNDLFLKLGVLKFEDIIKYKSLLLMYKAYKVSLPISIQQYFTIGNTDLKVVTRQTFKFRIRYTRTTLKSQCVTVAGPKLWNQHPTKITQSINVSIFKKQIKSHFLQVRFSLSISVNLLRL